MANLCKCNLTFSNTGKPGNFSIQGTAKMHFMMSVTASDGTKNKILKSDTLDTDYLEVRLNDPDPTKRWYPVGIFENAEDVRAEPQTQSLNNGITLNLSDGPRTYTGIILDADSIYLGKIESFSCGDVAVFTIDKCGALTGYESSNTEELLPIPVQRKTFNPQLIKSADGVAQAVSVTFTYSNLVADSQLRQILQSDWVDVSLLEAKGLLDATISQVVPPAATITEVTVFVAFDYGSFINKDPLVGLLPADFSAQNNTTILPIVVLTATPTAIDGQYTITFAAQALTNSITISGSKIGFEFTPLTYII